MTSTQITNTEIFTFKAVAVFNLLNQTEKTTVVKKEATF